MKATATNLNDDQFLRSNFRLDIRALRLLRFARNDQRMLRTVIARSVSAEAIFCLISTEIAGFYATDLI